MVQDGMVGIDGADSISGFITGAQSPPCPEEAHDIIGAHPDVGVLDADAFARGRLCGDGHLVVHPTGFVLHVDDTRHTETTWPPRPPRANRP